MSKYFDVDSIDEKYCYSFSLKSNREKYKKEFAKFIAFYNYMFFFEDRIVWCFNNIELNMNIKDLEHIIKLYLYSKKENDKNYLIIAEFIFTYYNSIGSNGYKKNYIGDYNQKKHELLELMKKHGIDYVTIKNETFRFYDLIFYDSIKEEDNFSYYYLERSCNNFKSDKNLLSKYIERFFINNLHIDRILKYDTERKKHKDNYLNYLYTIFIDDDYSRYPEYYILELNKYKILLEDDINQIINTIVKRVNRYIDYSDSLKIEFIQFLSLIDELNRFLNLIIKNIKNLNEAQKNKIAECLSSLLFIKRKIISNDTYSSMNLHEITTDQLIKNEEIKVLIKSIVKNPFKIYAYLKHDFYKDMENSIELFAKYPIGSMVSVYNIDSSNQIYSKPNDIEYNNPFKKIFDKYGKEYTLSHPKLMNKLSGNYYEEMLKRISQTSMMKVNLLYYFLKNENKYNELTLYLAKETHTLNNNNYIMVAKNIVYIEGLIAEMLKQKGLLVSDKGYQNIYSLLSLVNNDKDIINGLMYINYCLYEIGGFNLRNKIAHGTLLKSPLEMELLIVFACNVFVQWLYDKVIGDKNEN